jgi:hypothetical protein
MHCISDEEYNHSCFLAIYRLYFPEKANIKALFGKRSKARGVGFEPTQPEN